MDLTIGCATLAKALTHVTVAVERKNTIPILDNVLLTAKDGMLRLTATDLNVQVIEDVACEIAQEGAITAPALTLSDILRRLPPDAAIRMAISDQDPRMAVSSGRSRYQLPVLPAGDFPRFDVDALPGRATIDSDLLTKIIGKTRFAISTDETRYYLNGLYLHVVKADGQSMLRAVCTDGHRLALAEMEVPEGLEDFGGLIIPRKTVELLFKLLSDAGESVEMCFGPTKIHFDLGSVLLSSKVIDGSYPEYWRVVPTNNPRLVKVENDLFGKAIDRALTMSSAQGHSIRLNVEAGHITMTVRNMEAGQAVEEIEADYTGGDFEAAFNGRYLLAASGQMDGEMADLHFPDSVGGKCAGPVLITDPADRNTRFVVMPQGV